MRDCEDCQGFIQVARELREALLNTKAELAEAGKRIRLLEAQVRVEQLRVDGLNIVEQYAEMQAELDALKAEVATLKATAEHLSQQAVDAYKCLAARPTCEQVCEAVRKIGIVHPVGVDKGVRQYKTEVLDALETLFGGAK